MRLTRSVTILLQTRNANPPSLLSLEAEQARTSIPSAGKTSATSSWSYSSLSRHLSPTADNALASQLELAFEDNRLAAQLYGDFDQNLALIEQRLKVSATPRGNHVLIMGAASSVDQARRVLV